MIESLARRPATQRLYHLLRQLVLERPAGERLGSEAELLDRFDASRPTLRQAISLLEGEQLVAVRRGNGGGYYASRPTAEVATRAVGSYCRSLNLPLDEVIAAWIPIRVETVRLAARDRGSRAKAELQAFMAYLRRGQNRHFAQTVRRFNGLLATLAGNRLLSLFYEILYESGNRIDQQDFYRRKPERIHAYRAQMLLLAEAILAGDEFAAEQATLRCIELNLRWSAEEPPLHRTDSFLASAPTQC